jgi:ketosteroid isomerase-like protein
MIKFLVATLFLVFSVQAVADSRINAVDAEVRAELTALVEAWIAAEVQSDADGLAEILHEDFLSTFASGATLDRASYIDFIVALDIAPFKVNNESMVQHGDTVVVIDISESGTTKFTWIATRQNDQWKVISQTFSKVE